MTDITFIINLVVEDKSPEAFEEIRKDVSRYIRTTYKSRLSCDIRVLSPFKPQEPKRSPWVRTLEAWLDGQRHRPEITGPEIAEGMHMRELGPHQFRLIADGMRQLGWGSHRTAKGMVYRAPSAGAPVSVILNWLDSMLLEDGQVAGNEQQFNTLHDWIDADRPILEEVSQYIQENEVPRGDKMLAYIKARRESRSSSADRPQGG